MSEVVLLAAAALALSCATATTTTLPSLQTVFEPYEGTCYRIPAIAPVIGPDGSSVLVAAERRRPNCDDYNTTHDLVLARVWPNGTVGPMQVLLETGDAWYNPTFSLDWITNRTHLLINRTPLPLNVPSLLSCGPYSRETYILSSDDGGASWSVPRNITASVQPFDWRANSVGPGAGVQLNSGRLIVPAYHVLCDGMKAIAQTSGVFTSDDGGETWSVGGLMANNATNEAQAVVLANGSIALYARMSAPCEPKDPAAGYCRGAAVSNDGGSSFSSFRVVRDLVDPACEGSIVSHGDTGTLWYSLDSSANQRANLTLMVSIDQGGSWSVSQPLVDGPSGYSQMAVLTSRGSMSDGSSESSEFDAASSSSDASVLGVAFENGNNGTIAVAWIPL